MIRMIPNVLNAVSALASCQEVGNNDITVNSQVHFYEVISQTMHNFIFVSRRGLYLILINAFFYLLGSVAVRASDFHLVDLVQFPGRIIVKI